MYFFKYTEYLVWLVTVYTLACRSLARWPCALASCLNYFSYGIEHKYYTLTF
jgi:hypothetical protein